MKKSHIPVVCVLLVVIIVCGVIVFTKMAANQAHLRTQNAPPAITSPSTAAGMEQSTAANTTVPASPETASHLEFRGLRAGQTRGEVEAVLKKQNEHASLKCSKPERDGSFGCLSGDLQSAKFTLGFSGDGKLRHFRWEEYKSQSQNPNEFLFSVRRELAASSRKDAKVTPSSFTNMSDTFTWGTERTVVCPSDQEKDDCPAEELRLSGSTNCCSAVVEFDNNAYLSQGVVKKDQDRPKPKVSQEISFMNLQGGETRDQVNEALQKLQYPPLTCKYNSERINLQCTTKTRENEFDLTFVHSRLSEFNFKFPPNEHDKYYQVLLKNLGQPTDSRGKTGSELYAWESEEMLPCNPGSGNGKQCTRVMLILASPDEDPKGKVAYFYKPLMDTMINEQAQRDMAAIAAQAR